MNQQSTFSTAILLVASFLVVGILPSTDAFVPRTQIAATPGTSIRRQSSTPPSSTRPSTSLSMAQMGPVARAKKMMDPKEYNRIVEQKMAREGLTRQQAEAEYNQFLENPPFYYALDKKADCTCRRQEVVCFDVVQYILPALC